MSEILRKINKYFQSLSVEDRQRFIGVALGYDPIPAKMGHVYHVSDARALASDWAAIGHDMKVVIAQQQNERLRSSR